VFRLPDHYIIVTTAGEIGQMCKLTPPWHLTPPLVYTQGFLFVGMLIPPWHLILPVIYPGVPVCRGAYSSLASDPTSGIYPGVSVCRGAYSSLTPDPTSVIYPGVSVFRDAYSSLARDSTSGIPRCSCF
jgi:hypothetical protein